MKVLLVKVSGPIVALAAVFGFSSSVLAKDDAKKTSAAHRAVASVSLPGNLGGYLCTVGLQTMDSDSGVLGERSTISPIVIAQDEVGAVASALNQINIDFASGDTLARPGKSKATREMITAISCNRQ